MLNNEIKFLLKHSSIYGIGSVMSQVVGFLLLPLYTRYLTPTDYGVLSLINITISLIGIVIGLNISSGMSRFYFEYNDERKNLLVSTIYIVSFFLILLFLSSLYFIITPLSNLVFKTDVYSNHFLIALLALAAGIVLDIGLVYLRIQAKSFTYMKITLARLLLNIGLNVYFIVFLETGVFGIFYSMLIEKVIFSFILTIPILIKTKLYFSLFLAKEIIHYTFPLIFSNILRVFINESDKYFINYFFSPIETGLYSISQKISTSVHILITSPFLQSYTPRRFEIMKEDNAKETYAMVLNYYLFIIGTFGLLISMFSPEIIMLMTTKEYYSAKLYIPLLILSMMIFGMKYHFQIGILIHKKTKYLLYINFFTGAINLILNFVLISKYGLWGAIIAINISYLITTVMNYMVSQKLYKINFNLKKIFKLFLLIIIIYLLSMGITTPKIFIMVLIKILLFISYFGFIFVLQIVDKDTFVLFKNKISGFING